SFCRPSGACVVDMRREPFLAQHQVAVTLPAFPAVFVQARPSARDRLSSSAMRSRGGLTRRSTLFLAPALGLVACGDDASGKHWSALATCLAGPARPGPGPR